MHFCCLVENHKIFFYDSPKFKDVNIMLEVSLGKTPMYNIATFKYEGFIQNEKFWNCDQQAAYSYITEQDEAMFLDIAYRVMNND
jgi:hypothetical protein